MGHQLKRVAGRRASAAGETPEGGTLRALAPGAQRLPPHHLTIRVPWHDQRWGGTVCARPLDNTSCLVLPRIGKLKRDEIEARSAGQRFDELSAHDLPPCVVERAEFMAPFPIVRTANHPYVERNPEKYGHFNPTRFEHPPYSAACVPYRWMLRERVEGRPDSNEPGLAERLQLDFVVEREPDLEFETSWVQERDNQLAILDTFFGGLRREESLCFFYAKRTPLSEQSRRVIVGVGRVLSVGEPVEYAYKRDDPPLRCMLWERNIGHSIRAGYADGFLFPYSEILELAAADGGVDPEEYVAFAPDEHFEQYSYGSELLSHDGAIASLVACAAALQRIQTCVKGPWDAVLLWIDTQLNRLWKARGAFPGLGSALSAFGFEWGFQHGSLLAYEVDLVRERLGDEENSWRLVDKVMEDPSRLDSPVAGLLDPNLRSGWRRLSKDRRALLQLLSRCAISGDQALRIYDATKRSEARIEATDEQILANPYLLFEKDRRSPDPIAFGAIDRGLFPEEAVRKGFPVEGASRVDSPADLRRVRGLVVDILEEAAREGHTVLPRSWVIQRARERALRPPCPLGENVLEATEGSFGGVVERMATRSGEAAYQVDRLAKCREIIGREIRGRRAGRQHAGTFNWRESVDLGLAKPLPKAEEERELEERARAEKAAGLEQLFRSRLSVLVGPAGTGKTTLLRMLCSLKEVAAKGILLLAPTGKARVRLEEQTRQRGAGWTLAQFLNRYGRYDWETQAYFPDRKAPRCGDFRTVVIDECSMLTEEQLAAMIDALSNVERLVLVGDPRQLPPIGSGRPFVDIVKELTPKGVETIFPRCGPGYAELTIPRRHLGAVREDVLLAAHFSGHPLDPAADEVWNQLASGQGERVRVVQWTSPQDLHTKMIDELARGLGLVGPDDEMTFELSLGGSRFEDINRAFFWNKFGDNPGAASKVDAWQILSPVRAGLVGGDALNRMIQTRFRSRVRELAMVQDWTRKVPKPVGPQTILYGDKVINIINQKRRDVWPRPEGEAYIANGDIGIVVGEYKTKRHRGLPKKLEVEFAGQLGFKYGFWPGEFGDDGANPLELAYCLTVHKTQGSEFGMTFVVLPNPCWLMSRELLYTALTRHQDRLVILHQGPIVEFRHYGDESHSAIAGRMTNLFVDPSPREVIVGSQHRFLEDGLIHRTERGDLVRSKSELVIADKLFGRGIEYAYEQPLPTGEGRIRYPDFTIADQARGVTFYWEHLGLLDDPEYRARWARKREEYQKADILPWDEGGGGGGTLIETRDEPGGALDAARIAQLIDKVLLG